jgi:glyoxylase-like metal-dependent hydrolase (beta-lactamase superfamily II)
MRNAECGFNKRNFLFNPQSAFRIPHSAFNMRIERLVIPTPFPVGPINIYLIPDDPVTLVDTGPKTDEAVSALREQLRNLGFVSGDIRRIILTHTHEDHCGLAGLLQRESGAAVYVHEWELQNISPLRHTRANAALLKRAGVPQAVVEKIEFHYQTIQGYADPVEDGETYRDEDEFVFAGGSLQAIHTPGHTPGSCCLLRASNRLLLTGDTILKTITPNPVLNADPIDPQRRFPSLSEYLVSLARIRSLAPTLLKTSHGDDVADYEEHFHRLVRHIHQRQSKVIGLIPKKGITAWELSILMFPKVENINRFLAVSEAVANLDLAVADGKLELVKRDDVDFYHRKDA